MPPTARRRKRPHPARRARRLAGWLSVAAVAALTGCMATATKQATTTSSSTATSSPDNGSANSSASWSQRSSSAVAGNGSSQPVTSSHAS